MTGREIVTALRLCGKTFQDIELMTGIRVSKLWYVANGKRELYESEYRELISYAKSEGAIVCGTL